MAPDPHPFERDGQRRKPCAICGRRAADVAFAPFCSKRCADIDLHRWLGGVYAVPADEPGTAEPQDDGDA